MNIIIENVEIKKDQYEAIVKISGIANDLTYGSIERRDIERAVSERIIEKLVSEFLKNHTHEILSKIDQQHILNMIVLGSAKKIQG